MFLFQLFHPFEAAGYCKAIRAFRKVGKECILQRIKLLEDGGLVPNDILTFILKAASRPLHGA
jgi:hypothetical protein